MARDRVRAGGRAFDPDRGERFEVARGVVIRAHPDGHFELRDEGSREGVFEGVLLTALNGAALDGTIANYCEAAEGVESGVTVDVEALGAAGGTPRPLTVEMD